MKALIRSLVTITLLAYVISLSHAVNTAVAEYSTAGPLQVQIADNGLASIIAIVGVAAFALLMFSLFAERNRSGLATMGTIAIVGWLLFGHAFLDLASYTLAWGGVVCLVLASAGVAAVERFFVAKRHSVPSTPRSLTDRPVGA